MLCLISHRPVLSEGTIPVFKNLTHMESELRLYTQFCVCVCGGGGGGGGEGERERKNSSIPLSYETMNT